MRIKFSPATGKLRLYFSRKRRECREEVVEVKLGEKIFYVQIYKYDIWERMSLLRDENLEPSVNQEIAFLLKRLRQEAIPVAVILGRKMTDMDFVRLRRLWLQSLREFDLERARKIKEYLAAGGMKEYL